MARYRFLADAFVDGRHYRAAGASALLKATMIGATLAVDAERASLRC